MAVILVISIFIIILFIPLGYSIYLIGKQHVFIQNIKIGDKFEKYVPMECIDPFNDTPPTTITILDIKKNEYGDKWLKVMWNNDENKISTMVIDELINSFNWR